MVHAVRGFAEKIGSEEFTLECDYTSRINIPAIDERALYFFDFIKAHDYVREALERAVDERTAKSLAGGAFDMLLISDDYKAPRIISG